MKSMLRNSSGERADQHDRKWMLVVALVVGIMIGSLVNNPFQSDARNIELQFDGSYCFAIYKDSITFIGKAGSSASCRAG